MLKKLAQLIARSGLLARARELHAANQQNWNLPLTKFGKLQVGIYMILEDYSKGLFPPTFTDQQADRKSTRLNSSHG